MGLNLFMTLATACFGLVAMVAGIFGMNLDPLPISSTQVGGPAVFEDGPQLRPWPCHAGAGLLTVVGLQAAFWIVIASSLALALLLGGCVTSLVVGRRLLFIPKLQFALRAAGQRPVMDRPYGAVDPI